MICGGRAEIFGGRAKIFGGRAEICGGRAEICGGRADICGGSAEVLSQIINLPLLSKIGLKHQIGLIFGEGKINSVSARLRLTPA